MNNLSKIRIGDYIDIITDYHSNGSYKSLKDNVELLYEEDYALMARTLNFEQNNFNDNFKFLFITASTKWKLLLSITLPTTCNKSVYLIVVKWL